MGRLRRLDTELVRRKLAPSRTQAAKLIEAGRVFLDGQQVLKPARQLDPAQAIVVKEADKPDYASRGGYKLAGVLEVLGDKAPAIEGKRCLDAGASTGGFTDVLLRNQAASVIAVDVGYGQLRWELQQDQRVEVHDRTNVRTLTPEQIGELPDLIVSDLSFISLTLVLPALHRCGKPDAEYLLMVKPQFEIGKDKLGAGGVVRDPKAHLATVLRVIEHAHKLGMRLYAVAASPLPGPAGNVEYFIHLKKEECLAQVSTNQCLQSRQVQKKDEGEQDFNPILQRRATGKLDEKLKSESKVAVRTNRTKQAFPTLYLESKDPQAKETGENPARDCADKVTVAVEISPEHFETAVWEAICAGPAGKPE